ncbi:DUF3530 family protein [Marinobacter sediminum]|uniref:DUF3530 family protein n=1 Tax=Marinobacter sediminum TaxID=256323 RepID=UPI00202DE6BA|nr:DUF3530 family protein [Marinobacter sediminum]
MSRVGIDFSVRWWRVFSLGLWFACAIAFAQDEPGESPSKSAIAAQERPGVSTGLGEMALSRLYPEAAVWLELEEGDRALGLLNPEQTLPAKGALLILADAGGTAASGVSGSLAQHLAERGWAVLTVGLDAPSTSLQRLLASRQALTGKQSENATGEASSVMIDVMEADGDGGPEAAYRNRVGRILEAGLTELANREYDNIALLGVGRASNHIVALSQGGQNLRAMIWVAPVFYPGDEAVLATRLGEVGVPAVLELYNSPVEGEVPGRRRELRLLRAGLENFVRQPVVLQQPPSAQDGQSLASRIDAWLQSLER